MTREMGDYDFEYLFVNDGSKDATLQKIRELAAEDERVHYLSFSRNFGKEAALLAGLSYAKGDYVTTMDADLQDPPTLLPQMAAMLEAGDCDNVATRRVNRQGEPKIRSFFARMFYKVMRKLSHIEIADGARDYRLMNRAMVDSILSVSEYNRFSKGIFAWVGYDTKWLEFQNVERSAGESQVKFWKLVRSLSFDGIIDFYGCSAEDFLVSGAGAHRGFFYCNHRGNRTRIGIRGSGCRLAVAGMYRDMHWRNPAVLYGNYGTLYCKNLYGSQKTSALYHKGEYSQEFFHIFFLCMI